MSLVVNSCWSNGRSSESKALAEFRRSFVTTVDDDADDSSSGQLSKTIDTMDGGLSTLLEPARIG